MDDLLRLRLEVLATTAAKFANAYERRNPDYDWLTPSEAEALANLRTQVGELTSAEAKAKQGVAG